MKQALREDERDLFEVFLTRHGCYFARWEEQRGLLGALWRGGVVLIC